MITKGDVKWVLKELLNQGKMQQAIDEPGDYVYITVSVFNTGSVPHIISCDYNEETEKDANDNGDLFIDKEDALQLLTDHELDIEQEY